MLDEGIAQAKQEELEKMFLEFGVPDFKWIDPKNIVVAQWVRMKCMFGCGEYGKSSCCPPFTPNVEECRRFFSEYKSAVVFHFVKEVEHPEDRFNWTRKVNSGLSRLERAVFLAGYEKAFLLFMDSCNLCSDCTGRRENCKNPQVSRPAPEAMAVDVFSTVKSYGYPIDVRTDYSQEMNRYAFLLLD